MKRAYSFTIYPDSNGEYRWRLTAANGQIVAVSGEGYKRKNQAWRAVERIKSNASHAFVGEEKELLA